MTGSGCCGGGPRTRTFYRYVLRDWSVRSLSSPRYLPRSMNDRASWLQHSALLKANDLSEIWILFGPEGAGKSSTGRGILDELKRHLGWVVSDKIGEEADALLIDDVRYFGKRNWQGERGRKFFVFVRTIRGNHTLTLFTAPDWEDLDVTVRTSKILELVQVVSPGFCIWRDPISVRPRWEPEVWRRDVALSLSKELTDG